MLVDREAPFSIEICVGSLDAQPAVRQLAKAAPLKAWSQLKHFSDQMLCLAIALARDPAREFILDARAAGVELLHQHADRLHDIERLKARDDDRPLVFLRKILIGAAADHRADMRWPDESVDAHLPPFTHVGRVENALDRRRRQDVIAIDTEVAQSAAARFEDEVRGRRRRRLEADGEEYDLPCRMSDGDVQGLERRVRHAHVRALRASFEEAAPARCRHAQHVAIADQRHVGLLSEFDGRIEPWNRQHAYRTARTVHQVDVAGQQVLDAVAKDGMRMSAAKFHQVIFAFGVDLVSEQLRQGGCRGTVTEAADVAHRRAPRGEQRSHQTTPESSPRPRRRGG